MLAPPWHPQRPMYSHSFLPPLPSPLSPRSANIHGNPRLMSPRPQHEKSQDEDSLHIPELSHRTALPRAVKQAANVSRAELGDRRRRLFLRKVKEGRDDARFNKRAEDIMRLDFVQHQKQWEADQARSAPQLPSDLIEDDDLDLSQMSDLPLRDSARSVQSLLPEEEVEEVEHSETLNLEALLTLLPGEALTRGGTLDQDRIRTNTNRQPDRQSERQSDPQSEHFGSDDDDFDALFSELMNEGSHKQEFNIQPHSSNDMMDMS